jgi:hypothetical protein
LGAAFCEATEFASSGYCVSIPSIRRTAWRSVGNRFCTISLLFSRVVTSAQLAAATTVPSGPKMGSATETMP